LYYFQSHGSTPLNLEPNKRGYLRFKTNQYQLINEVFLFEKNYDSVLLTCIEKSVNERVLSDLHHNPPGGHFDGNTPTHNILHVWPTLFRDAYAYAIRCNIF